MQRTFGKTVVVALGGSILFPDGIDLKFIKVFKKGIEPLLKKYKFVFVIGGGHVSRTYQEALGKLAHVSDEEKDLVGVKATQLNARFMQAVLGKRVYPKVIEEGTIPKKLTHPITIASGARSGSSKDLRAFEIAARLGVREVVVIGKPAFVYDKDFVKFPNAKKFTAMTWSAYEKIIPPRWAPGSHMPVDPVAARFGKKKGIAAIVVNGRNIKNFTRLLHGKHFQGTIIS